MIDAVTTRDRGSGLERLTLATTYPCCGGRCRLVALVALPRETYDRRCPGCGQQWQVDRHCQVAGPKIRIDVLQWERWEVIRARYGF